MDVGRHPGIEILTLSTLTGLKGKPGAFTATVHVKPRYVREDRCTGCGDCERGCPQKTGNEWDLGLKARHAIYRPYPQAVPAAYLIDMDACLNDPEHFVCERCRRICKRDAIEHDMKPKDVELDVGAVVLATGFDEFHPHIMGHYGYGKWENIITGLEMERMLNATGPTDGHIVRPTDRKPPKNLAFVQCVGARGEGGRFNCSRYCCMNAVKNAILAPQHDPEIKSCTIFYTDLRAFGKGHEEFLRRAKEHKHIRFVRGRPSKMNEVEGDDVELFVEDTEGGGQRRERFQMVVLSSAGVPRPDTATLADTLGIDLADNGFFDTDPLRPGHTSREGVYVIGSAAGPRVIPECVVEASAVSSVSIPYVKGHERPPEHPPVLKDIDPEAEPRIGVFVCRCGANIARVVKVNDLVDYAAGLPNVVCSEEQVFACSDAGQQAIMERIEAENLNRVLVAACTPRTHEPVFRKACATAGLNPYLLEMANIRDQCTWVHGHDKTGAQGKARDLIRMAAAKAARLRPLEPMTVSLNPDVAVIGGGMAGMTAALELEKRGLTVTLLEQDRDTGGLVHELHQVEPSDNSNPAADLNRRLQQSGVTVHTGATVTGVDGYVGNFTIGYTNGKGDAKLDAGAIVLAPGVDLYRPGKRLGYGKFPNVITSAELEQRMKGDDPDRLLKDAETVAFIQCVGSRSEKEGFSGCSRYCCPTSVKHARELNAAGKDTVVIYRDMRTVESGAEELYRTARSEGVVFLKTEDEKRPAITGSDRAETITFTDILLNRKVAVDVDLVVLAVGMINEGESNETLRTMLKVSRSADGFLQELHPEMGPVETAVDGVFLCGTIQGPKGVSETIAQGMAAAGKAAELLTKGKVLLEPTICEVDPSRCRACGECADICDYQAPSIVAMESGRRTAEINPALCKGCGTCAVWCPTGAITARHFTDNQLGAMIETLFGAYHERVEA